VAADVGSGTGIFSRLLLEHGFSVRAVEPNEAMRREAERAIGTDPRFESIAAEAVATGLPDSSVDAVTVAQAFHWFANQTAVSEFARILRPRGMTLLVWNDRRTGGDRFHQDYEDLLVRYCGDYVRVTQTNVTDETIRSLFSGWECEIRRFDNHQTLDFESLRGRLESSSYCPHPEDSNYLPLMDHLTRLFERSQTGGTVSMEYVCRAYYLDRRGEGPRR